MSSRLDYQSPELSQALENPEAMASWVEKNLTLYQKKIEGPKVTLDDLLLCAELALRHQDASCSQSCLSKALKLNAKSADAYYLQAQLHALQEQVDPALQVLNKGLGLVSKSGSDSGRLAALKAQLLFHKKADLNGAVKALKQAYAWAGEPSFVHLSNQSELSEPALVFDLEMFEQLYGWNNTKVQTRFCALEQDQEGHLYVLENHNKWLFKFDQTGQLIQALNQRQLAQVDFTMPENIWACNDISAHEGHLLMTSAEDKIQTTNLDFEHELTYSAPASARTLRPVSLATDSKGNLYVVYIHLPGIHVFNAEGFHLGAFGGESTDGFGSKNYFCGLAIDGKDRLYLFDRQEVKIFDLESQQLKETLKIPELDTDIFAIEDYPFCWNGIHVSATGDIYLACTYENKVLVLDGRGKLKSTYTGLSDSPLNTPYDVVSGEGDLFWVTDTGNGRVLQYKEGQWTAILEHQSFEGSN